MVIVAITFPYVIFLIEPDFHPSDHGFTSASDCEENRIGLPQYGQNSQCSVSASGNILAPGAHFATKYLLLRRGSVTYCQTQLAMLLVSAVR